MKITTRFTVEVSIYDVGGMDDNLYDSIEGRIALEVRDQIRVEFQKVLKTLDIMDVMDDDSSTNDDGLPDGA